MSSCNRGAILLATLLMGGGAAEAAMPDCTAGEGQKAARLSLTAGTVDGIEFALSDGPMLRFEALPETGWHPGFWARDETHLPLREAPQGIPPTGSATPESAEPRRFFFGRQATDPVANPELIVPGAAPRQRARLYSGSLWFSVAELPVDATGTARWRIEACAVWQPD